MRPNTIIALGIRLIGQKGFEPIRKLGPASEITKTIIQFLASESIPGAGRIEIFICRDLDSLDKTLNPKSGVSNSLSDIESMLSNDSLTEVEREFLQSLESELTNG